MKEASGEANMTVIVVVLIGVVVTAGLFIVPRLLKDAKGRSCCTANGGRYVTCAPGTESAGKKCCGWNHLSDNTMENRSAFRSCRDS